MGVALSCIHLSFDDFCRLTLTEFNETYKAYQSKQETEYRDEWQRTRMLAAIIIQPHCKKKVTPEKLLPFPWEKQEKKKTDQPQPTAEESRRRFEQLIKKL